VSPEWQQKVGKADFSELAGGLGREGQRRRFGADPAKTRPRSDNRLIYAIQNKLPYGKVKNSSGAFVKATWRAFQRLRAAAAKFMPDDFPSFHTNPEGKAAIPSRASRWLLIPPKVHRRRQARCVKDFLNGC